MTTTWSQVSGPGPVTFGDASAVDTTASFPEAGVYVLRLTADDGALAASDETTITVTASNQAPFVDAGEDQTVGLVSGAILHGVVSDDGLPDPPGALMTTWRQIGGPAMVSFGNAKATESTVAFPELGAYVLRLTADDGDLADSDEVTITVVPETFTDLGGASEGVAGPPHLHALGTLVAGSTLSVTLADAAPDAPMLIWIAFSSTPFDAVGGTIHANPAAAQVLLLTDANGSLSASAAWPAVPQGAELYLQAVIRDRSALGGIALSNAVTSTTP
jgi:hypothetical protein